MSERDERQPKIARQKIKVERQNLIQQALKFTKDLNKRAFLEIQFSGEEGTGLGPTMEFYSLLSEQFKSEISLWRKNTVDGVLYPKSLTMKDNVKEICEKFQLAGIFVARSITDDRLMDLPISQLMWDILL
jgi:E3 ubiquitin-protein ligase TRIP12